MCLFGLTLLLGACGDPIGSPCRFQGSGFQASDNCRHQCMQTRNVVCPDGTNLRPEICSGRSQCEPGSCPQGQICYHVDDLNMQSYCILADTCGELAPDTLHEWELKSYAVNRATVDAWEAKKRRMSKNKTPAMDVEDIKQ
jgi:hypothetical protein